jgi:hypothetical protein
VKIFAKLALLVGGLALPVLVVELLLRFVGPVLPGNYDTGAYLVRHPIYGHYHPPNYSGWIRRDEFTTHVRTNSRGQRGSEIDAQRDPRTFRVLVLGDSFVEAVQVGEHERFIARLAEQLSRRSGRPVEVIDGGCGGWGQAQQLLYLEHEGWALEPDLVLVAVYLGNDVSNNSVEIELDGNLDLALKPYFDVGADGRLTRLEPRPPAPTLLESIGLYLRARSAAYNFLESGVLQKLGLDRQWARLRDLDALVELRRTDLEIHMVEVAPRWERAWAITEALLTEMKRRATARDTKLAVVAIPTLHQVVEAKWQEMAGTDDGQAAGVNVDHPYRMLQQAARRGGINILNLAPAMRNAVKNRGEMPYFDRDEHWNARGHAIAASAIADFVTRDYLTAGR